MTPRLTVVVPVYNVEAYLSECLDSIFSQNFEGLEVIAINDGSTDGSLGILREYEACFDCMRVIDQENRGLSATRNTGICQACGEYICWIDSDDVFCDGILEKAYSICIENQLDTLAMTMESWNPDSSTYPPADDTITPVMSGHQLLQYITENKFPKLYPWIFMFKRDFLLTLGEVFLEGTIFEGGLFNTRVFLKSQRAIHFNAAFIKYRVRQDSLSHDNYSPFSAYCLIRSLYDICEAIFQEQIPSEFADSYGALIKVRNHRITKAYNSLTEEEQAEALAMCNFGELMCFHAFIKPVARKNKRITDLRNQNKILRERNSKFRADNTNLKKQLSEKNKKYNKLKKSRSYRIGRLITKPARLLK